VARRILPNLALAAGATALVFALLEVGVRALGLDVASYHAIGGFTVFDPDLGWRLAPSRETTFKGSHFSVRVRQNAEGLRDRHYTYAREPGRGRILVLGDSVVWCWGVEQDDCFTERLERQLSDTDVINAGVPAYSTAQEMLFYEREARRYRPDLVVLVVVPNDPFENTSGWGPRFRLDGDRLVATNLPLARRKARASEWLQEHSRLFAQASYAVAVVRLWLRYHGANADAPEEQGDAVATGAPTTVTAGAAPSPPPAGKSWAVTEALLGRLAQDVAGDGARFALVLEAMPASMTERLQRFAAARGIPCLDLGPPLAAAERRGERMRLIGDPHLSAAGQQVLATELRAFLEREGAGVRVRAAPMSSRAPG
jgi:GDSL-like lipase/acylhydrolase family protein